MSDDNPYQSPDAEGPVDADVVDDAKSSQDRGRHTYNLFTDVVTGANVRLLDNVIQAVAIGVSTIAGAAIGAIAIEERIPGALFGAVGGMIVGLFASGIFLMIFRAVMHLRGKHD